MKRLIVLLVLIITSLVASEPISPIPQTVSYDRQKALLGRDLFMDPRLSKDNSTACVSCHDVFKGGADKRAVSLGFGGREGNIQAPTVLNAKYNFKQFWNGRADDLFQQANGPINNPAEHNMDPKSIEERLNAFPDYVTKFKKTYHTSTIRYKDVIDAIVTFENALITPNSKFDKYLRGEEKLAPNEKEGYVLFKQYGCITCHNGINIGGNSFQKMGTFIEYPHLKKYPDRSDTIHTDAYINVFKVPTLRNITLTAPYFHDASAATLQQAVRTMAYHNLGIKINEADIGKIIAFLHTLEGEKPAILNTNE